MIKQQNNILLRILTIMLLLTGLMSCRRSAELSVVDYASYINSEKSELIKEKRINNIKYKLRLITPEVMVLNNEKAVNESDFKEKLKKHEGQLSFNLIIEDDHSEKGSPVMETIINPKTYSEILEYANTEMINDVFLIVDNDTVNCAILHLEPANSIQPVLRFSVGLADLGNKIKECTFCFNDNLFNNGWIKFNYSEATFNNLPKIKF